MLSVFRVGKAENHVLCILRVQFCETIVTEAGRYLLLFLKNPAESVLFYLNFSLSCYKYILFNSVTAVSPTPYCLKLDIYAQVSISVLSLQVLYIFIIFLSLYAGDLKAIILSIYSTQNQDSILVLHHIRSHIFQYTITFPVFGR